MLSAMVCFQVGASFAKGLFSAVGAEGAATLRLAFAALMLIVVWRPWRAASKSQNPWSVLGYGAAIGCMTLCFYKAIATVPLGVAVALQFSGPLAVAIFGSRRPIDFIWVTLAGAGILLLLPLAGMSTPLDPGGVLFALGAGAGWGAYIVFGKAAGQGGQGRAVTFGTLIAAIVVAPFGIAHAGLGLFNPAILPTVLAVAAITTVVPYSLEMLAMTRLPPAIYGVLSSLEPAIGVLAGYVILSERLTAIQIVAVAAIIAASAGTVVTHKAVDAPVV